MARVEAQVTSDDVLQKSSLFTTQVNAPQLPVYISILVSYPEPQRLAVILLPVPTILYQTSGAMLRPLQLVAGPSMVAVAVLPLTEPPQLISVAFAQLSFAGATGGETVKVA